MAKFIRFQFHRICLILTLLFLTVGCDQITKAVARDALPASGSVSYFNQAIVLVHAENPGAFLSLGASLPSKMRFWIFTIAVTLVLLTAAIFLFRKTKMSKWQTIGSSLLIAGGIGNLIDRLDRGTVTDFINLGIGSWRTGIFNIADVAIVTGVLLWMTTVARAHHPLEGHSRARL